MSQYILREYYEVCAGDICEDLLNESDKKKIREMGANLKKITDQHYDINNVVGDRLAIYEKSFADSGFDPRNHRKYEEELKGMPDDPNPES